MDDLMVELPAGFSCHVANIGIKDDTADFTVIAADRPCPAAAVFTRSRFAGPSVTVSRRHVTDGRLQAFAVISKNANVANGAVGEADADEVVAGVAAALGAESSDVLLASTGVIGRRYPMDRVRAYLRGLAAPFEGRDALAAARAIMTTDTVPKVAEAQAGAARVVGIAKGVGMIEPDMATLITLFVTDAEVGTAELDQLFRRVIDRTFNALSIDTDTSTSDTAAILASGAAGPVVPADLEAALHAVALSLTRQVARDGEGATTLIEVRVDGRRGRRPGQACRQGHRQLAPREDRGARRRPELGAGGHGHRQVLGRHRHRSGAGRHPLRSPKRSTRAMSTRKVCPRWPAT